MNTVFKYLYRDASNYKEWGEVVFSGVADDPNATIVRSLDSGEFFIAHQIRIPEVFPKTRPHYSDDHCWHEFESVEVTTAEPSDAHGRTVLLFVNEMSRASVAGWAAFDPFERAHSIDCADICEKRTSHGPAYLTPVTAPSGTPLSRCRSR